MILTYFVFLVLFWAVGLIIWKNYYVTKEGKENK
ncbi:hypothetical protein J2Z64_000768 [Oceanobacillus polygoni]|uniref:Uncharacterized protein n=1 Tax=Oceanobacillus polygoni TaxID=1235259 RepID=A0A9X1CB41_9BACI|nr:hypothetical protein [Oceanobacillus polygoni]